MLPGREEPRAIEVERGAGPGSGLVRFAPQRRQEREEWPLRLQAVLSVIYLIFNSGYSTGPKLGDELVSEAIHLGHMLVQLKPEEAEIEGCLALMLITNGRRLARVDLNGVTVPISRQDRSLWNRSDIEKGVEIVDRAVARRQPGPYQIKAAIAACHVMGGTSDWAQIAALYQSLFRFEPTTIVSLNYAVAIAETGNIQTGLDILGKLQSELKDYQPYYAALAELLSRDGNIESAKEAYLKAIELAQSPADVNYLTQQRDMMTPQQAQF